MAALLALREANVLRDEEYRTLVNSYRLFSLLEARLQWMEQTSCTRLPSGDLLTKLAIQLSYANGEELIQAVNQARSQTTAIVEKVFAASLTTS